MNFEQMDEPMPPRIAYRARVRFNKDQAGAWEDVEANTPALAAIAVVHRGGVTSGTFAGGRLPVEVTKVGDVAVHRFSVAYSVSYTVSQGAPL